MPPLNSVLVPAAAMGVCLFTIAYVMVRLRRRPILPRFHLGILYLFSILSDRTRSVEALSALILANRGISGLWRIPQTARRLEDGWVLVAYVCIAIAQVIALGSDHRMGRRICATLSVMIWVTVSYQIASVDHEWTNSFPFLALAMLWAAIRLSDKDAE